MAVSDALLAEYDALLAVTEDMLQLARGENWDEFSVVLPRQHQLMERIVARGPLDADQIPQPLRDDIAQRLVSIDTANQEVIERAAAWQDEIKRMLGEISSTQLNVNRLGRAYR